MFPEQSINEPLNPNCDLDCNSDTPDELEQVTLMLNPRPQSPYLEALAIETNPTIPILAQHPHQPIQIRSSRHFMRDNPMSNHFTDQQQQQPSRNPVTLIIKVIFTVINVQLLKLPITSRILHYFLITNLIFTILNLSSYLTLCPQQILHHYQIWRLFLYPLADSETLLSMISFLLMNDVLQRLENYFGSVWSLYLVIVNWLLVSVMSLLCLQVLLLVGVGDWFDCEQCIGLYPLIFSLSVIESGLALPKQIYPLLLVGGNLWIRACYHPMIYCMFYCLLVRFDIACIIACCVTYVVLLVCPCVYRLSQKRIEWMESCCGCVVADDKYLSISGINFDSYQARGTFIAGVNEQQQYLYQRQQLNSVKNI